MKDIVVKKLEAAKELKNFTKEIMAKSLKTDYEDVNEMLEKRQTIIEKIDEINNELKELEKSFVEANEIKTLKKETREVFKETSELDNIIRTNINQELKVVKKSLNQPENQPKFFVKA